MEIINDNHEKISEFIVLKSLNKNIYKQSTIKFSILASFIFYFLTLNLIDKQHKFKYDSIQTKVFDKNFQYHNYQRELINEKIQKYAGYEQNDNEPYFLNGIIRKFKPKKCLEIGVAKGGSSIIILNAIKDINNSFLISLDIKDNYYRNQNLTTGFAVKKYFSELTNDKWHLYTGKQSHIFLSKLNLKFDFLFLDTVHLAPGELINMIEVLPFLEENAIVVLHDIIFHLPSLRYYNPKSIKFHPSQIYLMTSLYGDKIIIPNHKKGIENIGAIILYPNQEKYYLNYFILLLTPWDYIPKESFISELRIFIKKYYNNDLYLKLFDKSIYENKIYVGRHKLTFGNRRN